MIYIIDSDIACKVGLNGALLLQNIAYWCNKNRANGHNYHDGTHWTYNSVKAYCDLFPFWTRRVIENELKKLETAGYIKTGNFNDNAYDRTKWYALTPAGETLTKIQTSGNAPSEANAPNGEMDLTKLGNGVHENAKCTFHHSANSISPNGEMYIKQNNTKEKTQKETIEPAGSGHSPSKSKKVEIPFADSDEFQTAWQGFVEMRKEKKAKLTERAKELIFKKLQKLAPDNPLTQAAILDQSVEHNWTGVFPLHEDNNRQYTRAKPNNGRESAEEMFDSLLNDIEQEEERRTS